MVRADANFEVFYETFKDKKSLLHLIHVKRRQLFVKMMMRPIRQMTYKREFRIALITFLILKLKHNFSANQLTNIYLFLINDGFCSDDFISAFFFCCHKSAQRQLINAMSWYLLFLLFWNEFLKYGEKEVIMGSSQTGLQIIIFSRE